VTAQDVKEVAVIGTGTMGAGIAGVFARAGCNVRLVDVSDDLLNRGMANLRQAQEVLQKAKRLTKKQAASALARIRATVDLETGCRGVNLLVEAITEDLALKQEMFAAFDRLCPREAVFASNTSGLSISKIAGATHRSHLVAGMHFWNPPHIIPLVEVVQGRATDAATSAFLMDLACRLGKSPILVRRDVPGFVGNRLQFAVMREAFHILTEGIASAEDIDTAMKAGPGLRYGLLGPLETADLGGLDIFLAISRYLFTELNSETGPPALLERLVEQGRLGAKTGEGFYRYGGDELRRRLAERDRVLLGFLDTLDRERKGR
jgi:3-hydroxybutyryl-CoA dehydrogenase